jgi:hypothetical protein
MSKSLMVSLLSKANNGSELLEILNTLVDPDTDTQQENVPTLDVIEF